MPPEWHPPEEYLALLKGVNHGTSNDSQSEEGQASFHEHRKENEAHQRKAEKRERGHPTVMDIVEMMKVLMKILREVDAIYHEIVGGDKNDEQQEDDSDI